MVSAFYSRVEAARAVPAVPRRARLPPKSDLAGVRDARGRLRFDLEGFRDARGRMQSNPENLRGWEKPRPRGHRWTAPCPQHKKWRERLHGERVSG